MEYRYCCVDKSMNRSLLASLLLSAYSIANLVAWSAGLHLSVLIFLAVFIYSLVYCFKKSPLHVISILLISTIFVLLILSHPVTDWDARSIWFFHAKQIYYEDSLFAQLFGYARWSHTDYPVLVPSLAASLAKLFGFWNEIFPRASVVMALAPGFFLGAYVFRSYGLFAAWFSAVILICQGWLLNGYMDAIVAVYFSLGLALAVQANISSRNSESVSTIFPFLGIGVCFFHLSLLKNEGLILAILMVFAAVPAMWRRPSNSLIPLVLLLFYVVLWKLPVSLAGIETDLTANDGILSRGIQRVQDPTSWSMLIDYFHRNSYPFYTLFGFLTVGAVFSKKWQFNWLPALIALIAYMMVLLVVFLTTYHDLAWHLSTTEERLVFAFNLGTVTLGLYFLKNVGEKIVANAHKYSIKGVEV